MTNRTLIIAEAGVNHNGDVVLAKRLIDVAAGAGADLVKFQTFNADRQVTRTAQKLTTKPRQRIAMNPSTKCYVVWRSMLKCTWILLRIV